MRLIKREIEDPLENDPMNVDDDEDMFLASTSNESPGSMSRTRLKTRCSLLPSELQEVCDRLDRVEENMAICRRLDQMEARLDDVAQHQQAQNETNILLSQVLSELSRLSHVLTNRYQTQSTTDSTDLSTGITIVVPHSQHMP